MIMGHVNFLCIIESAIMIMGHTKFLCITIYSSDFKKTVSLMPERGQTVVSLPCWGVGGRCVCVCGGGGGGGRGGSLEAPGALIKTTTTKNV